LIILIEKIHNYIPRIQPVTRILGKRTDIANHGAVAKAIFARMVAKHGIKMKAVVAVQRRLLEIIYILYKTGTVYDKHYLKDAMPDLSESIPNDPIAVTATIRSGNQRGEVIR